jgi:hypothetical protein
MRRSDSEAPPPFFRVTERAVCVLVDRLISGGGGLCSWSCVRSLAGATLGVEWCVWRRTKMDLTEPKAPNTVGLGLSFGKVV